ncbi:hypothetical protein CHH27_20880 [Labrenzia sp. VG12]|nr:hypothetical protein CHH27_20880 [Labrenzia sp. VG12]
MINLLKSWGGIGAFLIALLVLVEFNNALKDLFGLETSPLRLIWEHRFGTEEATNEDSQRVNIYLCATDKLYRARNNCDGIAELSN